MKSFMKFMGICFILAGCAVAAPVLSQQQWENQKIIRDLGSVRINQTTVKFLIAYSPDAAILEFSVTGSDGRAKYAPLFASTHRGIKEVTLNAVVSKSNDQLWIESSWPGEDRILAHYRFGSDTVLTPFGPMRFLDTPYPENISGGPLPFPPLERDARVLATFHHVCDP